MKTRTYASIIFLVTVIAVILVVAANSDYAEGQGRSAAIPPSPGFPVKVAIIAPFSGPVQSFGESTRDGALVAIQEAQNAGWDIQTVFADSKCDSQEAVTATNKVIFEDGVKYIIGAVCSSASIPISEIAEANHVVQISPSSTNPRVTVNDDGTNKEYVFRACFLDPFQGKVMAAVARELGATKAAVLYNAGNDYVRGLAEYFKSSFESMGGSVPVYEAYTSADTDFSSLLTQVDNANVDVLFLPDFYGKVNDIAGQANSMGLQTTFLGGDGWDSPSLQLDQLEGAYFSTHFWAGDPRQVVVDFVQTYSATHGTQPDSLAALGYDAAGILLQAIAEAGSDDPSVVKDKMAAIAYEGVTGKIAFNEFGDPVKGAAIIKIEGGQTVFVKYAAPPVSNLVATNDSPTDLGDTTTLTATAETESDAAYTWAFGDGSTASGRVVTHTYATVGTYMAVVTATNSYDSITTHTTVAVRETVTLSSGSAITTSDEVLSMTSTPGLTQTLTITYTPQLTTSQTPGDLELAGVAFHLDVSDQEGNPVTEPSEPLTLTIHYNEDALPPYMDEAKLEVRRYDSTFADWVPLQLVGRDTGANAITVLLDHFSEYALLGPVERLYLPLVMR